MSATKPEIATAVATVTPNSRKSRPVLSVRNAKGKKTANASFIQVVLNGQTLQKNVEMKAAGPGGVAGREAARGPLMLQGNHGVVAYRNIKIIPLKDGR